MKSHVKMNWLRMEYRLREALKQWKISDGQGRGEEDALGTIFLISEIIGEETGRGFELD